MLNADRRACSADCIKQIGDLASEASRRKMRSILRGCARELFRLAIRRAKRAEGKCEAFSEAESENCPGWRFGERSEPKKNAEHLARLRQSGQFQEKKDRKE